MRTSDDKNRIEPQRDERFAAIDRAREAFEGVPAEEIERETDRIIARDRAAARVATYDASASG